MLNIVKFNWIITTLDRISNLTDEVNKSKGPKVEEVPIKKKKNIKYRKGFASESPVVEGIHEYLLIIYTVETQTQNNKKASFLGKQEKKIHNKNKNLNLLKDPIQPLQFLINQKGKPKFLSNLAAIVDLEN